ncbi:MAG: hypothetical protein FJ217_01630 [Ignavibacteria bacterium]|nr:hypothetical protein [Ignavibacteria bacterium]
MRSQPAKVFSLVMMFAVAAWNGCHGQRAAESGSAQELTGILYVTGNEPFTQLSLQTPDGVMHPINKDSTRVYTELLKLQGRRVEVSCRPLLRKSIKPTLIIERYRVVEER